MAVLVECREPSRSAISAVVPAKGGQPVLRRKRTAASEPGVGRTGEARRAPSTNETSGEREQGRYNVFVKVSPTTVAAYGAITRETFTLFLLAPLLHAGSVKVKLCDTPRVLRIFLLHDTALLKRLHPRGIDGRGAVGRQAERWRAKQHAESESCNERLHDISPCITSAWVACYTTQ